MTEVGLDSIAIQLVALQFLFLYDFGDVFAKHDNLSLSINQIELDNFQIIADRF